MLVGIITFFASHHFTSSPNLQIIALTAPYFFFISIPIVVFYAIKTRWDLAIWFGIVMGLTWEAFGGLVGFNFTDEKENFPEYAMHIASFNAAQLKFTNDDFTPIAEELKALDPDIICLQEVGIKEGWQNKDSIGIAMATALKMPYYSFSRHKNNIYGLAIFSKFPITHSYEVYLPISDMNGILEYEVKTPKGKKLTLFNFHLASFNLSKEEHEVDFSAVIEAQQEQVKKITEHVDKKNAHILVGDLNSPPYLHTYELLIPGLEDAFTELNFGYGATLTNWFLPYRIDYQLFDEHVRCVDLKVLNTDNSDHKILLGHYEVY